MAARKSYMTPFWMMSVLTVIVTSYYVFAYLWLKRHASEEVVRAQLAPRSIEMGMLIVETIAYWLLRKATIRRSLIWFHVGALWFSFLFLAFITGVVQVYMSANYSPSDFYSAAVLMARIRFGLFWGAVVIGHIFFVVAIVDAFRNKRRSDTGDDELEQAFS